MKIKNSFPNASAAIAYLEVRGWVWLRAVPSDGSIWTHPRVTTHNCWIHPGIRSAIWYLDSTVPI